MLRHKLVSLWCAAALTLPACAENDTSLFVSGVLKGKQPECEYRADQGSVRLLSGTMDVAFTTDYRAILLVALQMTPRGDKNKLRAESMGFQVRGAEVRLTDSVGNLEDEFSVPAGGHITPTTAATPGLGLSEVTLIPDEVGRKYRNDLRAGQTKTLVAEIRVFGDTEGGADLTSGSFSFTIDVCRGCLTRVTEGGYTDTGECNLANSEDLIEDGCYLGQDGGWDCRLCAATGC